MGVRRDRGPARQLQGEVLVVEVRVRRIAAGLGNQQRAKQASTNKDYGQRAWGGEVCKRRNTKLRQLTQRLRGVDGLTAVMEKMGRDQDHSSVPCRSAFPVMLTSGACRWVLVRERGVLYFQNGLIDSDDPPAFTHTVSSRHRRAVKGHYRDIRYCSQSDTANNLCHSATLRLHVFGARPAAAKPANHSSCAMIWR